MVFASFSSHFHDASVETLSLANQRVSESSKFVFLLKKGISFFASSSIPEIDGYLAFL
ncbi:MAG: hypothetical protein ACJAWV_002632 [Flammeovirgaceae bacterium]|jgi:hypothetical protein